MYIFQWSWWSMTRTRSGFRTWPPVTGFHNLIDSQNWIASKLSEHWINDEIQHSQIFLFVVIERALIYQIRQPLEKIQSILSPVSRGGVPLSSASGFLWCELRWECRIMYSACIPNVNNILVVFWEQYSFVNVTWTYVLLTLLTLHQLISIFTYFWLSLNAEIQCNFKLNWHLQNFNDNFCSRLLRIVL